LRAAFWGGRFGQHIERYANIDFDRVTDLQRDRDYTLGIRMTGDAGLGAGRVRGALNWLMSTHRQNDTAFSAVGSVDDRVAARYRQMLFSVGSEYEVPVAEGLDAVVGASIDGSATPVTGDKPGRDPDVALGITTGLRKYLGRSGMLRLSAGRKVRFPTMRELFGEALQRFALNSDLKAESSLQSELAFEYSSGRLAGEIVVFYRRTFDSIDQEVVEIDGERKRRRINLDGSRTWGVEVGGSARLAEFLSADGHVTWMDPRGFVDGVSRTLNEKPELLASLSVRAAGAWGGSFQTTWIQTGSASALLLDNSQARLPASSIVNLRLAFREFFSRGPLFVEFYAGANNVLDAVSLPQLGLPGPGREFRLGAEVSF
jgi:iron complex outermembrane receptor protein